MSENTKNTIDVSEEFGITASISEDISEPAENVISSPKPTTKKRAASQKPVANNVIGSASANKEEPAPAKSEKVGKVTLAIHSTKNVTWEGVGKVSKGYNIVSKEQADKWLTRKHIRLATPEEVAKEYGE
jgi:hypothetical protein